MTFYNIIRRRAMRVSGLLITFALLLEQGAALRADADSLPAASELVVVGRMSSSFLNALAASARPSSDGATSRNRGHYLDAEFQRATDRTIPKALTQHDVAALATSIRISNYTFAHQRQDGGFEYDRPNGHVTKSGKLAPWAEPAAAAFFLEDFGHTMLLLSESKWLRSDPSLASVRAQVKALTPAGKNAVSWLVTQQDALKTDTGAVNRTLMYGAAYYFNGRAFGNQDAIAVGESFIRNALSRQMPDGTFPELGGFDSSYQAVSLYLAQIIYLQADPSDTSLRTALWASIERGMERERSNLLPSGEMSTEGNTRVSGMVAGRQHIDALDVNLAFQYYAAITQDESYAKAAALLFNHYPSY